MIARLLAILTLLGAAMLSQAGPAIAQNDIMKVIRGNYDRQQQDWFQYNFGFGGPRQQPRAVPAKPRKPKARISPFEAPKPAKEIAEPEKPAVPPSIFVNVLGDSLAELLADGLKTQLEDRPDIAVVAHTKSSSGFVRDDYYDWTRAVDELLASGEKIDAAVLMIGANDRQQLREADQSFELRSDAWKAAYIRRIDGVLALLKARNIKIYWVGLPPMKSDKLTADIVWFNEIYRERTEAAGGIYLDIWDGFVDADGAYAATGPDINGQIAKLRAGDGVHFSKAGSLVAAHYVEKELRRAFGDAPMAAAPTMTSPLALPDAPPAAGTPGTPPEEGAAEAEKPEYGPVMPLDVHETSPGAILLGGSPAGPSTVASSVAGAPVGTPPAADPSARKVLVRGEPLPPKDGRADDFRWPRNQPATEAIKTSSRPLPGASTP